MIAITFALGGLALLLSNEGGSLPTGLIGGKHPQPSGKRVFFGPEFIHFLGIMCFGMAALALWAFFSISKSGRGGRR